MNKQPVSYLQTDSRWASKDYSAPGESTTIGKSGCGPTCAAMLIETLTGKTFTPADACAWALKKGYKAPNQGTYYSYFVPQFKEYGIQCERLNTATLYGNSTSSIHTKAFDLLKQGYYLIACMGPGLWTSSGHYVVVWWEEGWVYINDPASQSTARIKGNLATFKSQVKYYWTIDAREYNNGGTPSSTGTSTAQTSTAATSHTAVVGDTLSKIATKYGTTVAMLAEINNIKNVNVITVGQVIYLTAAAAAIAKLAKLGVINSPDYWTQAVASGKVQYLDELLTKAAAVITKAGTRTATPQAGITALVAAGVISSPDYWIANYGKLQNLGALLQALGGAVK